MARDSFRFLNRSQLAEAYGVNLSAVDRWVRRGCPVEMVGRSKRFDIGSVAAWREAEAGQTRTVIGIEQARAAKLEAEAGMAQIELARIRGEVVAVETVGDVMGEEYGRVRARLLSLAVKLAPRLATARRVTQCRQLITDAIRDALAELSDADDVAGIAVDRDRGARSKG